MSDSNNTAGNDPLFNIGPNEPVSSDYPAHVKSYRNFISLARWFALHTLLILLAIYFIAIAGRPWAGIFFLVLSFAAFLYSIARRTTVPEDVGTAMDRGLSH